MKARRLFMILAMFALCAQLMTLAARTAVSTSRGAQGPAFALQVR